MDTALLFRRDAVEEIEDWADSTPRLPRSSVLWIDLERPSEADAERLGRVLGLSDTSVAALSSRSGRQTDFADFENYLHVGMWAPTRDGELTRVTCLVADRWVVTVRDGPLEVVETFRERASGSGDLGRLEGLEFLATLFEWVLGGYLAAFEKLAALATRAGVEGRRLTIKAPLLHMSKADIIRRGIALGLDYGLTHSCYDPAPDGRGCGRCDSCVLRAKGFCEAGAVDPLVGAHVS